MPPLSVPTPHTEPLSPAFTASGVPRGERYCLAALFVVLLGLRVLYACNMNFNSDEAQHLHVVWAWANGLLQYRDVFDNHTPLFHMLCAPVFRLFGETAMVMIYMRLAMIPLFAATLFFVVKIGARIFSLRAGLWAAVFTGYAPFFFLKTVEFRTDVLWTAMWLGTVAVVVCGRPGVWRMFCAGLMLGATFGVSMKTTLLALALLCAGLSALVLWRRNGGALRAGAVLGGIGGGLAGMLIVPVSIVGYFAARHAVGELYYGVIGHNIMPSEGHSRGIASRLFWFPATLPFLLMAAHFIFRGTADRAVAARRVLVLLAGGFYITLLHSYWPMITSQDYPPVIPLFVILLAPGVLALADWMRGLFPRLPRFALPLALALAEIAATIQIVRPKSQTGGQIELLSDVLRFTDRGDYVMDAKSGAIFRQRPFHFVLENVTRTRMERGLIADDIVERLISTRTCVASDERLLGKDRAFVMANYLPFARKMRIAGQHLDLDPVSGRAKFDIEIPAPYVIITPHGPAAGMLDGKRYTGKVMLAAGPHEFVGEAPTGPHLLVWAQALERGFQPSFSAEPAKPAGRNR